MPGMALTVPPIAGTTKIPPALLRKAILPKSGDQVGLDPVPVYKVNPTPVLALCMVKWLLKIASVLLLGDHAKSVAAPKSLLEPPLRLRT